MKAITLRKILTSLNSKSSNRRRIKIKISFSRCKIDANRKEKWKGKMTKMMRMIKIAKTHMIQVIMRKRIIIEKDGYLEEIRRMEVQEHTLIGQPGLRLVLKTHKDKKLLLNDKLIKNY